MMKQSTRRAPLQPLWLTLPLALYASGCVEVTPPDDAVISCDPDGDDCPDGWTCKPNAEGENQCVKSSGTDADVDPPELAGAPLITPALGTDGTRFTVCFSASESLSSDPVVNLNAGAGLIVLEPTQESIPEACAEHDYAYAWTASPDKAAAGTHPLTVTLFDEALNKADGLSLGTLSLDFAAPVLSGGVLVEGSPAKIGSQLRVSFSFDEETEEDAMEVDMALGGNSRSWAAATTADGYDATYVYIPTGEDPEGAWQMLVNAADKAGNRSENLFLGEVELDFTPPLLELSTWSIDDWVGPGFIVVTSFPLIDPNDIHILPALTGTHTGDDSIEHTIGFSDASLQDGALTYTYAVLPNACEETDRSYDLHLLGGADQAGNAMDDTILPEALRVDCLAPQLVESCLFAPDGASSQCSSIPENSEYYRLGDTIHFTFSLDEAAPGSWEVLLGDGHIDAACPEDQSDSTAGDDCCRFDSSRTEVSCWHTVNADDGDGAYPLTARVSDDVGNQRQLTLGTVILDATAPQLVGPVIAPNPANGATRVEVSFSFSEPMQGVILDTQTLPLTLDDTQSDNQSFLYYLPPGSYQGTGQFDLFVTGTDLTGNALTNGFIGTLMIDSEAPDVAITNIKTTADLTPPRVAFEDTISFNLDTGGEELTSLSILFGSDVLSSACGPFQEFTEADYRCSYTLPATGPGAGEENSVNLLVNGFDQAGNLAVANAAFVVDDKPPEIMSAQASYQPGSDNVLSIVNGAKDGTTAIMSFSTHENANVSGVTASCTSAPLQRRENNTARTFFIYEWLVTSEADTDNCIVSADLADDVGNQAVVEVVTHGAPADGGSPEADSGTIQPESFIVIDNTPPSVTDSLNVSNIKHVRIPYGAVQSNYEPAQYVADIHVGNFVNLNEETEETAIGGIEDGGTSYNLIDEEEVAKIRFFDAESGGTLQVQGAGLDYATKLNGVDSPELFAEVVDYAGNISERVRVVSEYVMTFADDENQVSQNPATWLPGGPSPRDLSDVFVPALTQKDAVAVQRHPPSWHRRMNHIGERAGHALAYDAARGLAVLFGGAAQGESSNTWEYDGISWKGITPTDPEGDGNPSDRLEHALTYDVARGVVVLHGGRYGQNDLSDTWEYDGYSWKNRLPTDPEGDGNPMERSGHSLTYDYARGKVVLFGGIAENDNYFSDTWEYDGISWHRISPTDPQGDGNPPARYGHGAAYDVARGVTVLFGGKDDDYDLLSDTWEYDGMSWRRTTYSGPQGDGHPHARLGHSLAYDVARGNVVLFGGDNFPDNFSDTWEYDGMNWHQITPSDAENDGDPSGREGHALIYDVARGITVLFGGACDGLGCVLGDTWEFDGQSWNHIDDDPGGDGNPSGRFVHSLTYDAARGVVVLFGGSDRYDYLSDTWEYDGLDWRQIAPSDPENDGNPVARDGHTLTYHAARGVTVLFGGYDWSYEYLADTWEYDGISWKKVTPLDPENDGNPGGREHHKITYDAAREVLVLYGGGTEDGSYWDLYDTWEYDGLSWREIIPTDPEGDGNPSERSSHSLAYDAARNVVVMFGGQDNWCGCVLGDTWEYDGTSWQEITPIDPEGDGNPSPRDGHSLIYHAARGVVVLFGGSNGQDLMDIWEYNGSSWKQIDSIDPELDGHPMGRRDHSLSYDEARGMVVLFGGLCSDDYCYLGDTWEYGNRLSGLSLPLNQTLSSPNSLLAVTAVSVSQSQPDYLNGLHIQTKSPKLTKITADQITRELEGNWETITHTIIEPAQLQQLATGSAQNITVRVESETLDPDGLPQMVDLDYLELRFLYDLDYDHSVVEPACGDGVTQPWLGEVCDDLNTDDGDYCSADCTQELGSCGDGIIQESAGEVCDGETTTHWCSSNCWYTVSKG